MRCYAGLHLEGQKGPFAPLKTGWPPWAMLCVLLLIIDLTPVQNSVDMFTM